MEGRFMDNDMEYSQEELNNRNWKKVGTDLYLELKFVDKKRDSICIVESI